MYPTRSTFVVSALLTLVVLLPVSATAQDTANLEATDANIRNLQQQRLKTIERAFQAALNPRQTNFRILLVTQLGLLDAQLDMADTREDQMRVLESNLKNAKDVAQIAQTRLRGGSTSELDVQQAESAALRIEITLLKLRGTNIRDLQQQRLKTLERAHMLAIIQYQNSSTPGSTGFTRILETQLDLLDAQLDIAGTRKDQTAVLESNLKRVTRHLEITEARWRNAVISGLEFFQAKSGALRVEIELLKLRQMGQSKNP